MVGQSNKQKTFDYLLTVEAGILECNILGEKRDNSVEVAPKNSLFTKIGSLNQDTIIIRFWNWDATNEEAKYKKFNLYEENGLKESKYFLLSTADFEMKAIERFSKKPRFTAGTVIIPVKMRFNDFDFSKDFTLGPTVGVRNRISNYSDNFQNYLIGFGITSVSLDSASTEGAVTESTDRPALTPSLGYVLEFSSAQVGIFLGVDLISDNKSLNWKYQSKPWVSFGLGYSILSRNGESKKQEAQTQ